MRSPELLGAAESGRPQGSQERNEKGKVMTRIITSYERSTGMGAFHCTQYQAMDGEWYDVGEHPNAHHVKRDNGFEVYEVDFGDDQVTPIRAYHRSNRGNENIVPGEECWGY